MSEKKFKTIRIKVETLESLVSLKRGRDIYGGVINHLIKQINQE